MFSRLKFRGSWRKIRSKVGIRSDRVAIRSHVPWYIKFGGYGLAMGVAAAVAWGVVDNSYRITGFNREEAQQQLAALTAENQNLQRAYENCLRRRALRRPTFLRSTSRASRVTKPAFDSCGFRFAS